MKMGQKFKTNYGYPKKKIQLPEESILIKMATSRKKAWLAMNDYFPHSDIKTKCY